MRTIYAREFEAGRGILQLHIPGISLAPPEQTQAFLEQIEWAQCNNGECPHGLDRSCIELMIMNPGHMSLYKRNVMALLGPEIVHWLDGPLGEMESKKVTEWHSLEITSAQLERIKHLLEDDYRSVQR